MTRTRLLLAIPLLALASRPTAGAEIALLPAAARLRGPDASQRVLVEAVAGGMHVADRTAEATFAIDNPAVARVSPDGLVTPNGDGSATLTATVGDHEATAAIVVEEFGAHEPPSFKLDVLPVLTKAGCNSGACHGAAAGKNGFRLTLRGYGPELDHAALTRQTLGRRIVKSAPAESLMLLKPTGAVEHGGGVRFATDSREYRVLADWIAAGAPAPRDDEPTIVSIQTLPDAATLAPGQAQQLLVLATDSAGHVADVTRLAKFDTTDAGVARVDPETGLVEVKGAGEAAVTAWFSSLVAATTITSPSATPVDPARFDEAPRNNPIDDLNLAKLRRLGIPPSPDAGDAEFLRRAFLDATGTLPPADVARAFLADDDPQKRATLVDHLLDTPEYVDYWTYKWSDLLLVSSFRLPKPAMWAFSRFIRRSVEDDVPWDEFARRVVTAKGSTLRDGAANYFVLHRDPVDLTESTSMAFLGLSLTCARCHNHPLEKWTQDQYYGMANLFARVKLKDGDGGPGDVVVASAPEGDIRNPRSGEVLPPQPLDAEALPIDARGDRREALADWLASPENPYFDRAIVNRVWRNFFGRGLVEPEDDLRATNPPSDAALMAWLVDDFRAHGRSVKHLIRTIMNSAAYARSSTPSAGNEADVKFLSHHLPRRLPAEVLLDAVARVSGVPRAFPGYPAGWRSLQLPDVQVANEFLDAFGRPERLTTCSCERTDDPSVAQALHLANGDTINESLRSDRSAPAQAIAAGLGDAEALDDLFWSALSRPPSESERAALLPILAEAAADRTAPEEVAAARRRALEDLYWAVLTSKEFLFNH